MPFLLRVATLNLRNRSDRWAERLPLIVAGLARERPHAVGLQEASIAVGQADLLTAQLNDACRAAGQPLQYDLRLLPKVGPEGQEEGVAILTRLPILEYTCLDLEGGSRVAQRARLGLPGGRQVDLYNTHLHHERGADELRLAQARRLLEWMEGQSGGVYRILVGDMNALPASPAIQALKGSLASAYELVHDEEPAYTFPTPLVRREDEWRGTLDYILVPRGQGEGQVVGAWRAFERPAEGDPTLYASDHYGLVAEVTL